MNSKVNVYLFDELKEINGKPPWFVLARSKEVFINGFNKIKK